MKFTEIYSGTLEKDEIRPRIKSNTICFPINVQYENTDKYGGDARSFGYPVDDGDVTIVKYDCTVGALTEDTIALFNSMKTAPRRPSSGVCPIDAPEYSEEELGSWKKGLSEEWAEARAEEWIREGLISEDEKKEEIKDALENYNCWPIDWQTAYDEHRKNLNSPAGELRLVLTNESLKLYQDEREDFFFQTKYHNYGKIEKADKAAALDYIDEYEVYVEAMKEKGRKNQIIKANLDLLKETLGKGKDAWI